MRYFSSLMTAGVLAASLAVPAQAGVIFDFVSVTNNNPDDVFIGETQLQLEVQEAGAGLVDLTFHNVGDDFFSIANIYFDSDLFTDLVSIDNGDPGVDFAEGGSPGNLPGGSPIGFVADFMAAAAAPKPKNGVNPGEYLGVTMSHTGSFNDIVEAIGMSGVGLHAIAFASGGSESFVTVPAPGALSLLAIAGLAGRRRRRA